MATYVTFSGESKEILVKSGTTDINVQEDLYSPWKEWVQELDNSKYLHAFRSVGGDPTAAGQYTPRYFFLMNGWRVVVDGSLTAYVEFAINLYVEEGGSPFVILNGANVSNLRSDIGIVESELEDTLDYAGYFIYDTIDGESGTTHPTGTHANPVNNCADLQSLMDKYDIHSVKLDSDMVLTQGFTGVSWTSEAYPFNFDTSGQSVERCYFKKVNLYGDTICSSIVAQDCFIGSISNVYGVMSNCSIDGNISLCNSGELLIMDCAGGSATALMIVDKIVGVATTLNVRRFAGGISIINSDHSNDMTAVAMDVGMVNLDASCTAGSIQVAGQAVLTDNSNGSTVNTTPLLDVNVHNTQMSEILGLVQSNFIMTDQVYNLNDDLLSATVKTYPTSVDLSGDTNIVATYHMTATYAGELLSDYRIVKV